MSNSLEQRFAEDQERSTETITKQMFSSLVQERQYLGEVYSMGYETALVQIHDFHRRTVGGIPALSFLIATRVNINQYIDYKVEDASVILLRVMDGASLPNDDEALRIRVQAGQRVSGATDQHWDSSEVMDASTANLLSFAGVRCRVIGTFFLDNRPNSQSNEDIILRFGSDISNYYPNMGLKVYKPTAAALSRIINYRDPDRDDLRSNLTFSIGKVRYASTNRSFQDVSDVNMAIMPADLLGAKTALFGMTRTGKSNTTKIIIKSVFELRLTEAPLRIGQLVFDPNGEYANENTQDMDEKANPSAIKNLGRSKDLKQNQDVVTYGITPHPKDEGRKLMLLNFYEEQNLQIGKEIVNSSLSGDTSKYIQNFVQVIFEKPEESDYSAMTRYKRRVLVYRTLLNVARFTPPINLKPLTKGLFKKELLQKMQASGGKNRLEHEAAAKLLDNENINWDQLAIALKSLDDFITDKDSGYDGFEEAYMKSSSSGESWADETLKILLTMFRYPNGPRQMGKVAPQHTNSTKTDFADDIYQDLTNGKLVIIDQSSGDPDINQSSADRIMWHIFRGNQGDFRRGDVPSDILVYIEEAHNLLPSGSDMKLDNVWVRTAKEGAKYRIGMVYATQEVSSIQRNILKNTANWFIGHLNNTDETRDLAKFYDFADFEMSIRRAQDKGFLRVKTLSNLFVVPVQINKFEV